MYHVYMELITQTKGEDSMKDRTVKYFPNYDGRTARVVYENRTVQIALSLKDDDLKFQDFPAYTNDAILSRSGKLCMMFREDRNGSTEWSTVSADTMKIIRQFLHSTGRA